MMMGRVTVKFPRWTVGICLVAGLLVAGVAPGAMMAQTPEATPIATPGGASATPQPVTRPTDEQLRAAGVNELGVVPVLMYHTFTSDPANVGEWTRTLDGFRDQLQQLYDMGFVTIPMRDLLENRIDVPLGKHPIVLTFDDSSASQFLIDQNADGTISPRPGSGVGVLEEFFNTHPDFGHSAFFAVVPDYCFADADIDALNAYDSCQAKLDWLAGHGYEIGNHTISHANLGTVDPGEFVEEVGGTVEWIDERVSGPANMSRVLMLPYGGRPEPGSKVDALLNGWFRYDGEDIKLEAVVDVGGGPTFSPSSTWWDPMAITRFNTDPASMDYWLGQFASGDVILYTSDGNPDTITVPNPIPDFLANEFDAGAIQADGKQLVRYDTRTHGDGPPPRHDRPATPAAAASLAIGQTAVTTDSGVRLRDEPGTDGTVLDELPTGANLQLLDGPTSLDGQTWWKVKTDDGEIGWVVAEYLRPAP